MVQHLARDHDVHRAGAERQGAAVGEHRREARRPGQPGGCGNPLDADEGERDSVSPGARGRGAGDVAAARADIQQGPPFRTLPPSPFPRSRLEERLQRIDDRPRPPEQPVEARDVGKLRPHGGRLGVRIVEQLGPDHPPCRFA